MQDTETRPEAPPDAGQAETNRGRVRRLLLDPLGFRSPRGTAPEAERKFLDALADELGYMRDAELQVLAGMLRSKGGGSARNFWPDLASFRGFAELVAPRPLAQMPKLLSWFGSVEGPKAAAEGTLVETYAYLERNKVPPASDGARRMVREEAAKNAHRLRVIEDRRRAGAPVTGAEAEWARWYCGRRAWCDELVRIERARKERAS